MLSEYDAHRSKETPYRLACGPLWCQEAEQVDMFCRFQKEGSCATVWEVEIVNKGHTTK